MASQLIHPDPVPRPAALVRDFVNTLDHELGTDAVDTSEGLAAFLADQGLLPATETATEAQRVTAVRLRAALHSALELNHDAARDPLPEFDAILADLSVRLAWNGYGVVVLPVEDDVDGALARIALAAHEAMAQQVWWRLKICAFDECEWAYYDQSKNRSRSYCEYGCGNKLKTRAYRARRRSARVEA